MTARWPRPWRSLLFVLSLNAWPALAQAPAVPAEPPPAGSPHVVPEKIEPQRPIGPPPPGDFVVQPPPSVDPEMAEPPPDQGKAVGPVIKPPPPPE